jgi:tricorn protease
MHAVMSSRYWSVRFVLPLVLALWLSAGIVLAQTTRGYYRDPSLHQQTVVFTAEGDLWKVSLAGGEATRLTTHLAEERSAAISPDGTQVAFSASYEGPREVYLMPIHGGLPRRLTFDGESARVAGWTPTGQVVYATQHFSTLPNNQLATIDPETLETQLIPLSQANQASWLEAGNLLVFTRLAKQGSSTKRYKGGSVESLWRFETGAEEAQPLTAGYAGTSRNPMAWRGRIYFASDRDGTMNIWSMDPAGGELKQHSRHSGFDVLGPSLSAGTIVYQLGADLWRLDVATNESQRISITITSDFDQTREKWIEEPLDFLSGIDISPDGERVALTARGQVFVFPVKKSRPLQITRDASVRFRDARFLDNQSLVALSDQSGELEYWELPISQSAAPRRITRDGKVFRYAPLPSPDGKQIAHVDKDYNLWISARKLGGSVKIANSTHNNFYDLCWSPDSQFLAYVVGAENWNDQIRVYSLKNRSTIELTTDRADSYSPAWSADGSWLYFLSDRNLVSLVGSPWGPRQPEPFFDKTTRIYELALVKDLRSPFRTPDELVAETAEDEEQKEKPPKKGENAQQPAVVSIDADGIQQRIRVVPVPPGNYDSLQAAKGQLYYTSRTSALPSVRSLLAVQVKHDPTVNTISSEVKDYQLSGGRTQVVLHKGDNIHVFAANGAAPDSWSKSQVDISDWTFPIDPVAEWRQMFIDAWRLERDYFYDPNLHNVDWNEVLVRHLPLVDRVTDRAELNDLIEQMVGELEALHIYVRGGDHRQDDKRIWPASLGAVLSRSEKDGGYLVDHVYQSDPDYPEKLSPLARAGVNVEAGLVIQSIDGVPLLSVRHPHELLRGKSGESVLLEVKQAADNKSRRVIVEPISASAAASLRYDQWEYTRRLEVERLGEGNIGYVHLRAMGRSNIAEWARHYYPVFNRSGLIIDVRHNRGGNIDSWILGKLLRKSWFYWKSRVGEPTWNMQYAFRGHMVVLCDEKTASDGEAFTEGFRRLGMGQAIGTRTWGGEIWLSFNNRLVDRGIASAAQTGVYGPEGAWLIEGHGVDPDIVVDNLPHATYQGRDAQLEAAIKHLQAKILEQPVPVPPVPPYPDKKRR